MQEIRPQSSPIKREALLFSTFTENLTRQINKQQHNKYQLPA